MISLDAASIRKINAPEVTTLYLYEITHSETEPPLRWTSWDEPVLYNGQIWTPKVISHTEITTNADGSVSPVTMTVGNIDEDRLIQQAIEQYGLIGKPVKIIQILSDGNHLLTFQYCIARAKAIKGQVSFTLSIGFDIFNIVIPGRRMLAAYCPWQFGDEDCAYTPEAGEECENTWQNCKQNQNSLNFGGFPGVTNDFYIF